MSTSVTSFSYFYFDLFQEPKVHSFQLDFLNPSIFNFDTVKHAPIPDAFPIQSPKDNFDFSDPSQLSPPEGGLDFHRSVGNEEQEQIFQNLLKEMKELHKVGGAEALLNRVRDETIYPTLMLLPTESQQNLFVTLADICKKGNKMNEAIYLFKCALLIDPTSSQVWMEYAKCMEEMGRFVASQKILRRGLEYCPCNKNLMVKAIKLEEKLGNVETARILLGRTRGIDIERSWRVVMQGAELEARQGNYQVARKIFKFLMKTVPVYVNVFQGACMLEERCYAFDKAIDICERGLVQHPNYALYLSLIRMHEKVAVTTNYDLTKTREAVDRALQAIPKELKWKVYFEAAQIEERAGNLKQCREAYFKCVQHCPKNLSWKVWLAGARTELKLCSKPCYRLESIRKLISRSLNEVPSKKKVLVLLEWARIEEFAGNIEDARNILARAKKEAKQEWKVFLETVLLEMRCNDFNKAIRETKEALQIHSGTGRLWAVLVQLCQFQGIEEQWKVFKDALQEVPKSGEVWCEGARIYIAKRKWTKARQFLDFSIQFTPQYGDSFIEIVRLEMLQHGLDVDISHIERLCVNAEPNYGNVWMYCKKNPLDSPQQVLERARNMLREEMKQQPSANSIISSGGITFDVVTLNDEDRWRMIFGNDHLK